jgi:cholesterol oxidase
MGTSATDGVVDHKAEVFGHPGLYVADGALFPAAVGLNPSRTIAALAERIADLM